MRYFLLISLFLFLAVLSMAQQSLGADLAAKWEHNKSYTLDLVAAMPEADYGFKPTNEVRSFLEQGQHLLKNSTLR